MNMLKVITMKDYTAWDLNAPIHFHNRRKMENMFRRKGRRFINAETRKILKEI